MVSRWLAKTSWLSKYASESKRVIKPVSHELLLGTCVPYLSKKASRIRVNYLELDTYTLMYFRHELFFIAYDPNEMCKSGDVVLIRQLPEKLTTTITHRVLKVVYPLGDITDPVTNKKVTNREYRKPIEQEWQLFGHLPSAFDYNKAAERGWQEDKKDFSHRQTYIQYHKSQEDDPLAVNNTRWAPLKE